MESWLEDQNIPSLSPGRCTLTYKWATTVPKLSFEKSLKKGREFMCMSVFAINCYLSFTIAIKLIVKLAIKQIN